jgi:hypothetical protein
VRMLARWWREVGGRNDRVGPEVGANPSGLRLKCCTAAVRFKGAQKETWEGCGWGKQVYTGAERKVYS